HAVLLKQFAGVVVKPGVEFVQFAGRGIVRAHFVATRVPWFVGPRHSDDPDGQNEEKKDSGHSDLLTWFWTRCQSQTLRQSQQKSRLILCSLLRSESRYLSCHQAR